MQITISIIDNFEDGLGGAFVSITLSNTDTGQSWTGGATTDADGTATLTLINAPSGTFITTITNVTAEGFIWDGVTPSNEFPE